LNQSAEKLDSISIVPTFISFPLHPISAVTLLFQLLFPFLPSVTFLSILTAFSLVLLFISSLPSISVNVFILLLPFSTILLSKLDLIAMA